MVANSILDPNSVVALLGDSNDEIARDIYYDDYDSEEYYNHEDDYERYEYGKLLFSRYLAYQ